jgi:hypothetical protein
MTSENPRAEIYDPKTLAVMDKASAAVWNIVRRDDPSAIMPTTASLELPLGTS